MAKFVFALALLGCALAEAAVIESSVFTKDPGNYEFNYNVKDIESASEYARKEEKQDKTVKGEYRTLLPDGRMQIVDYLADDHGFHPSIRYEEVQGPVVDRLKQLIPDGTSSHVTTLAKNDPIAVVPLGRTDLSPAHIVEVPPGTDQYAPPPLIPSDPISHVAVPISSEKTSGKIAMTDSGNFRFQYDVDDKVFASKHGRQEEKHDNIVKGEYHTLLPDGRVQIVDYVADDYGYHPNIRYEKAQDPIADWLKLRRHYETTPSVTALPKYVIPPAKSDFSHVYYVPASPIHYAPSLREWTVADVASTYQTPYAPAHHATGPYAQYSPSAPTSHATAFTAEEFVVPESVGELSITEPASYNFQYDVNDVETGSQHGRKEEMFGGSVTGEYHVLLPNGQVQMVEYLADNDGFHPSIHYVDGEGPIADRLKLLRAEAEHLVPVIPKYDPTAFIPPRHSDITPAYTVPASPSSVQYSSPHHESTTPALAPFHLTPYPPAHITSSHYAQYSPSVPISHSTLPQATPDDFLVRTTGGLSIANPDNYKFQFDVDDSASASEYARKEEKLNNIVKGEYRTLLPDGRVQIVDYLADSSGFHPSIHYE